jgi:hypothetical protein
MNLRRIDRILDPLLPFFMGIVAWYFFFGKYFIPDLFFGMIFSWAFLKCAVVMTVVGYAMIVAYGIKVSLEQDRIMKASYH